MTQEPVFIVLLGPPASGKGTQAARLKDALDLAHVASGDLFRQHLKNQTQLGAAAKAYIDRGDLVPDELTIAMVMERLGRPDAARGAILDGFPRTMPQALALERALQKRGHKITLVLSVEVPDDVLIERVSGRRLCPTCGAAYHVRFSPPCREGICDNEGAALYQRTDDQPEVVKERLRVYWEQTSPLIGHYQERGLLVTVDGQRSIDEVTEDVRTAVAARMKSLQ